MAELDLKISLVGKLFVRFGDNYHAKGLLTRRRLKRCYDGIDWSAQRLQSWSGKKVEVWLFAANRDVKLDEVQEIIDTVKAEFPKLERPAKELGLCLLKRFPKKRWYPEWVLLHEPISHPKKEFPHVSTLSGSKLGGSRTRGGAPFGKECLFVFYEPWD